MSRHGKLLVRNAHDFPRAFPSKKSINRLVKFSIIVPPLTHMSKCIQRIGEVSALLYLNMECHGYRLITEGRPAMIPLNQCPRSLVIYPSFGSQLRPHISQFVQRIGEGFKFVGMFEDETHWSLIEMLSYIFIAHSVNIRCCVYPRIPIQKLFLKLR